MAEEYLDLVDQNNQLTGKSEKRSIVHSTGLWHRAVHVYFFRQSPDEMELLVHLRSKLKDLNPNKWDTRFGGHPKAGETLQQTIVGELKDEIGLDVNLDDLIVGPIKSTKNYPNNEFYHVYFYKFNGDENKLHFNDGEVQAVRWLAEKEIKEEMAQNPENWSGRLASFNKIIEELKNKLIA